MMKLRRTIAAVLALALLTGCACVCAEAAETKETEWTTKIAAHFATQEEGQELMRNQKLYHEQINEKSLEFLLQKKGGTLEEFIDYAAEQVRLFEPEEEQKISDILEWLQKQLESHGLALPDPGPITFVKTTGWEAGDASGYTSEGAVFLNEWLFTEEAAEYAVDEGGYEDIDELCREVIIHEISHCLSRLYPEYRAALYSLIHFRVLDEDIDIPQKIRDEIMANPDVEHHDSVATFTINGEKKECYLVFLTDDVFEKEGDNFFDHAYVGIVPLGEDVIYRAEDVKDFWDVVGENTEYAEDPEEIMADNFSFAIMYPDEFGEFKNPGILEGIVKYLKK